MDRPIVGAGHMDRHPQNDWQSVRYDARFDEYSIAAGDCRQCLFFCPWCGEALPPSQRDRWFDAIEALGLDPAADPLPEAYRDGSWRGAAPPSDRGPPRGGAIEGRFIDLFDEQDPPP